MTAPASRRGFTLVELLVVTGLFAVFFGLIVNGLRPNANSQVRQLSQSLSSAILAAQTQAFGSDTGAALILEVTAGNAFTNTVFRGDVPPFIVGNVTSGMPPAVLSATSSTVTLSPINADTSDLSTGYTIRFSGTSPQLPPTAWMGFSSINSSDQGTVSLRTTANQTPHNTVWPAAGSSLQFEIARLPVKSDAAADVTKFAAIDLRYSGIGNTATATYGTLSGQGSVGITFDRIGSLDTVILYGPPSVAPVNPTAPLYLLIASMADIEANTSLQSQTSRWLAIAPGTGRVSIAANVPVGGTTQADINNARANARLGVTAGVK